jgi:uncharacterized protein YndB with AHSA1/START domain
MIQTNADVVVPVSPDRAFDLFTSSFGDWWPSDYTWSQDALVEIAIESDPGGMCYEVGPHGFRCDFGRVLTLEPGEHLVFTWQISPNREPVPDPEDAGEVSVEFAGTDAGTRVYLTHRHFERHESGGEEYCRMMGSDHGWPLILERFADFVEDESA